MEIDEIKTKIKFAINAVEDIEIDKDYKIESFKIILNKLLSSSEKSIDNTYSKEPDKEKITEVNDDPMEIFANKAGLSKENLLNVLHFKDNQLSLLRIKGTKTSEQNYYSALMILAFWKIAVGEEFTTNVKLGSPMSKYGISTDNLSATLKKNEYKEFIVIKGKGKSQEYRITTKGIQLAYEIIKELAQ